VTGPAIDPIVGPALDELLAVACDAARAGGARAAEGRRRGAQVATKSTVTDLVTVHDRAAEDVIVGIVTAARPDDGIVGEEGTDRPGTSGVSWYLDPIDGTTNYVYDLPAWATSVAAGDRDGMLVGAVYVPVLGELFAAARGRGATLNGHPIRCSRTDELALALVATGFGYTPERRRRQAAIVAEVVASVRDIRRLGAASLDLCYVAAGRFDAYFEEHLNIWDMAAGELIAREAGCRSGDYAGGPARPGQLAVAAPGVFDALVAALPSR
jgi:myo-inositol-1(or 4)-monophosphatase